MAPPIALRARLAPATLALAAAGCGPGPSAPPVPPNVIVCLVDTLRADYLGFGGFDGPISPAIDAFAAESVVFERCVAPAPWTKPSVASLFTSLHPAAHGLTNHEGRYWGGEAPNGRTGVLPAAATTLAETLRAAGYVTGAFVANPWITARYGFAQGFDVFDEHAVDIDTPADRLFASARSWLDGLPPERPFFAYLHLMDVHAPYDGERADYDELRASPDVGPAAPIAEERTPHELFQNVEKRPAWASDELRRDVAYWRARYASGVRALDRRLATFFDWLRRRDLLDESVLVFTSDHGEELYEHGSWSHGANLFEHQLHVPLFVRLPGGQEGGRRVGAIVSLLDLAPTLAELAGVAPPAGWSGRSFARLATGDGAAADGGIGVATATRERPSLHALRTRDHKLVLDRENGEVQLFDLRADPGEAADVAASERARAEELRARLEAYLERVEERGVLPAESAAIPPELEAGLRALGYL